MPKPQIRSYKRRFHSVGSRCKDRNFSKIQWFSSVLDFWAQKRLRSIWRWRSSGFFTLDAWESRYSWQSIKKFWCIIFFAIDLYFFVFDLGRSRFHSEYNIIQLIEYVFCKVKNEPCFYTFWLRIMKFCYIEFLLSIFMFLY